MSLTQRFKFFRDCAKSAFTYEDFISNQLGIRFLFQYGPTINSASVADREMVFTQALWTFFAEIGVLTDQRAVDEAAKDLPTIERFEARKTTLEADKRKHSELLAPPP